MITLFPKAVDDRVDLDKGKYHDIIPTNMRDKYEKEICFALGVTMIMTKEGNVKGCRCKAFDYTSKTVISKKDWNQKIKEEISRVKRLIGNKHGRKGPWCVNTRDGRVFEEDIINPGRITGLAEKKKTTLAEKGKNGT